MDLVLSDCDLFVVFGVILKMWTAAIKHQSSVKRHLSKIFISAEKYQCSPC